MGRILRNILIGAGSVLELSPPVKRVTIAPHLRRMSAEEALASDWRNVGESMRIAMSKVSATLSDDERERLEASRSENGHGRSSAERDQPTLFDNA